MFKTGSSTSHIYGVFWYYGDGPWVAPTGNASLFADPLVTTSASGIACYDHADVTSILRYKSANCKFILAIESNGLDATHGAELFDSAASAFLVYVLSDSLTDGFVADFKPYLLSAGYARPSSPYTFTATSILNGETITFSSFLDTANLRLVFVTSDDNDATRFQALGANNLTAKTLFTPNYGPASGFSTPTIYMKIVS